MESSFPLFESFPSGFVFNSLQSGVECDALQSGVAFTSQSDAVSTSFQSGVECHSLQSETVFTSQSGTVLASPQSDTVLTPPQSESDSVFDSPPDFISFPTRKTSLDLSCFFESMESPVSSATLYSDEVPAFELCVSVESVLREKKVECYARECRARRANRVAILKRKRELGLISFESRVRYAQRSELAQKRDRCSGRFMKDIEYMDV